MSMGKTAASLLVTTVFLCGVILGYGIGHHFSPICHHPLGHFVLHPGQFVLGITLEWMNLPIDLSGYVTGKSSWGRRGLIIETATGIHPGFTGCLTLEFANVGSTPIELSPGMQACQIFCHKVKGDKEGAVTQFVGFRKPGLGRVERDATLVALGKSYFPASSACDVTGPAQGFAAGDD